MVGLLREVIFLGQRQGNTSVSEALREPTISTPAPVTK
jgi:hypothetical protein